MDSSVVQDAVAADPRLLAVGTGSQPSIGEAPTRFTTTRISVVMPTTDFGETFGTCAKRVIETLRPDLGDEFLVVFDGEAPSSPDWLADSGITPLATNRRAGPAAARNLAAESARGDVILFVDADVELVPDALERVRAAFDTDPDLCGVFGAYDAEPAAPGLVSRFRNLLHHHTHVRHAGPAETFWAGCGAMRTGAFLDLGGFDTRYREPSIEDIELGSRAAAAGGRRLHASLGNPEARFVEGMTASTMKPAALATCQAPSAADQRARPFTGRLHERLRPRRLRAAVVVGEGDELAAGLLHPAAPGRRRPGVRLPDHPPVGMAR